MYVVLPKQNSKLIKMLSRYVRKYISKATWCRNLADTSSNDNGTLKAKQAMRSPPTSPTLHGPFVPTVKHLSSYSDRPWLLDKTERAMS